MYKQTDLARMSQEELQELLNQATMDFMRVCINREIDTPESRRVALEIAKEYGSKQPEVTEEVFRFAFQRIHTQSLAIVSFLHAKVPTDSISGE